MIKKANDTEERDGTERNKNLYRIGTTTDDGKPMNLVLQSDDYQFKVAEETIASSAAKNAGEIGYARVRYYPTALQAIMALIERLSKAEAKDLKGYVDALQKYRKQIIGDLRVMKVGDPQVKR